MHAMTDIQLPTNDLVPNGSQVSLPFLLQAIRKQRGLTQERLAKQAGLTRLTVASAEGDADARISSVVALFRALDCELLPVPKHLVAETRRFINNGGRLLAIEPGVEAPLSVMQRPGPAQGDADDS
jgi:transcriptional regulator with XRE-family HTH domain